MTQLAAAVDADDEVWTLDALPPSPFVQVDDELIEIRARYPDRIYQPTQQPLPPKIRVRRGAAGTTAASHVNGSTLTPVYGAGAIGGVQQVRLLGPFSVDHSEMEEGVINIEGLVLTTIPVGSTLIRATIFVTSFLETTPSHDNPTVLQLRITESGTITPAVYVAAYDPENQTQATAFAKVESGYSASYPTSPTSVYAKTDLDLRLLVDAGAEWIGFGSVDVYALIAEPA